MKLSPSSASRPSRPRARGILLGGILLAWQPADAVRAASGSGFGSAWIADTAAPATLQTQVLPLGPEVSGVIPGRLRYELGFSTREMSATGFLFDSLTLSLARADGSGSTVLVTGDVFGLTIAPLTPGGLLATGGISATEVSPGIPALEGATVSFAYTVEVELPPSLQGVALRTTFDFFNNGDGQASQGYAFVVPEPSIWALLAAGGGLGLLAGLRPGRPRP